MASMMNRTLSPNRTGLLGTMAALLLTASSGFLFTGCSGSGGSGGGGGQMFVQTCSLGCSNAGNGLQVSCAVSEIFQNQEIAVLFSEPVDPASLSSSSFRIINPANSTVPFGSFLVDPTNSRRVLFRPALTIDPVSGQPSFGLDPSTTYQITIPGVEQNDPAPYISSMNGRPNQTRLFCTVTTGTELVDLVPGPPVFSATLSTIDGMGGLIPGQPVDGAVDVSVNSEIRFEFNDIMNSATLVDAFSGTSSFIRIETDTDGDLTTDNDRSPVGGTFVVDIDELFLQTTVVFTPQPGLPSAGEGPNPLKVIVTLLPGIQDISGENLANAGLLSFTPEVIVFPPIELPIPGGEDFTTSTFEDRSRSGARWENGILRLANTSGGSGRLGDLILSAGETVTLDTDSQEFPLQPQSVAPNFYGGQDDELITNAVPGIDYDPTDSTSWPSVTITDGIFEFANLRLGQGSRLILTGSNPGRIIVRGEVFIGGTIDIAGESPGPHDSTLVYGQSGGAGGPNAGSGGDGGARFDLFPFASMVSNNFNMICRGGAGATMADCELETPNPNNPNTPLTLCPTTSVPLACPILPFDMGPAPTAGQAGGGVGQAAPGNLGGAPGGVRWPNAFPQSARLTAVEFFDGGFNRLFGTNFDSPRTNNPLPDCISVKIGGAGGGASYGRTGTASFHQTLIAMTDDDNDGTADSPVPLEILLDQDGDANKPPTTAPGDQAALGINEIVMALESNLGNLRGGAGGGGAGLGLFGMASPIMAFQGNCRPLATAGSAAEFYADQSGGAGGGGGGALQLFAGRSLALGGRIDASGGDGGSALVGENFADSSAAPGGGGSGGAVRLMSPSINLVGEIDVSGGEGGLGVQGSRGGDGGAGLVRLEAAAGSLTLAAAAQDVAPFDPLNPDSDDILSIATLAAQRARPESLSGSVSCWLRPPGLYNRLDFPADDFSDPNNPVLAWEMTLRIDNQPGAGTNLIEVPFRGPNSIMMNSFEQELGNMLNVGMPDGQGSPVAVRFQGARLTGSLDDLCDLDLNGLISDIAPDSLTPWVSHPEELSLFDQPADIIRYSIIFDRNLAPEVLELVRGVTNLSITALRR